MSIISIIMLMVLSLARAMSLVLMSFVSIAFLRKISIIEDISSSNLDPDSTWIGRIRKINPSIQSGLLMISSSGVGMSLLVVRQILLMFYEKYPWAFLLYRDPDLIGEVGYSLCSTLAAIGVVLTVRGLRAVIIPSLKNKGDMPNPLKPNWG